MGLLSTLKELFGTKREAAEIEPIEYKGFNIYIEPRAAGGQYGVGARITRTIDGEVQEHIFIRADTLPSIEVCQEVTLNKAKMTVDQQGDKIFRP